MLIAPATVTFIHSARSRLHPALKLWFGSRAKVPNRLGTWLWGWVGGLRVHRQNTVDAKEIAGTISDIQFFSRRPHKLRSFVWLGVQPHAFVGSVTVYV